jgi:hypothetical protein
VGLSTAKRVLKKPFYIDILCRFGLFEDAFSEFHRYHLIRVLNSGRLQRMPKVLVDLFGKDAFRH